MAASMTRETTGGVSARNLSYLDQHLGRYVESGTLAGTLTVVYRRGEIVHWRAQGLRDRERGKPIEDDTIFRIYSMTKPIASLALMQLYERGLLQIDDPVHKYIPSWEKLRVYESGTYPNFVTRPCERPMTVRDLLTHQSGLTYGFATATNVDAAYRELKLGSGQQTVQQMVEMLAELPLEFSPGTAWLYSHATDIVGHLVEVISGQPLDAYFQEHIFEPLGMTDTAFWVKPEQADRLATNYAMTTDGQGTVVLDDAATSMYLQNPIYLSGGGGLVSTAGDYLRFSRMLLGKGTLDGQRLIGRKTLELMTQNHITGGRSVAQAASQARWREGSHPGNGFGLGFAVKLDTADGQISGSAGEYNWSGAANTHFWIDPAEDLAVVFMTQLMSIGSPIRLNLSRELRAIVYGALD
ncbi:MAG: serine hydrolase domain-containing protein [Chloroflexota bacterium]